MNIRKGCKIITTVVLLIAFLSTNFAFAMDNSETPINNDKVIDEVIPEIIPVSGVVLDDETLSIEIDNSHELAINISPENATNQEVTWTSSDDDVATVNENGTVTGLSLGTSTITVITADGGFTAECLVGIIEKEIKEKNVIKDLRPVVIGSEEYQTDRFIIKYKDNNGEKERLQHSELFQDKLAKVKKIKEAKSQNYEQVVLNQSLKTKDFIDAISGKSQTAEIEYIQPDYQLSLSSSDPYFNSQWGVENSENESVSQDEPLRQERIHRLPPHLRDMLERYPELMEMVLNTPPEELRETLLRGDAAGDMPGDIPPHVFFELAHQLPYWEMADNEAAQQGYLCDADVVGAWEKSLGEGTIVAVIDTGIDINHEDLAENIWINTGEIPGNGIDDDNNGYVDDVNGWNFPDDNSIIFNNGNPQEEKHGTHIAGTIAAVKDNEKGITGTAPKAEVMALKAFANGTAYTSDIIAAIEYAEKMGAKIANCSWGSTMDNPALEEAIEESEMLFVCAAGNSGADIDSNPVYPASFGYDNIISVASVGRCGQLSSFSNYGQTAVDVAAPGEDIISTTPGNNYENMSGTSMAAAFVSGEAALLLGMESSLSPVGVKDRIIRYSDRLSSLTEKVLSSNKVNFTNAVYEIYNDEIIMVEEGTSSGTNNMIFPGSDGFTLFDASSTGLLNVVQVAGGYYHSLALKEDGTVWTWGRNNYGQLGDGTTTQRTSPVQVSGLSGVKAIAGGSDYSMALKEDGTVWTWGRNYYGQLGDGTTTNRTSPVQVSGLTGVKAIAGGGYYSLALKEDGTVWSWGDNNYGQLGDGTTTNRTSPVQVSGLSGVKAIAGGSDYSLALKEDGTVWTWGRNYYGQLGDGTTTNRTSPVQVSGLTGVKAIAGGGYYSLALKEDGTVWSWGDNNYGQLGDGTTTNRTSPVQVSGLTGITAIAGGGSYHSLALKENGTVWAWGYNNYGQLGDGTMGVRTSPVQVSGLTGVTAIAGGDFYSLALKEDGTVWSWGRNNYGQLGDGTMTDRTSPVQASVLTGVTAIAGGYYHSLALKENGTVWAWGYNECGQLGDGTMTDRTSPVQVSGLTGVTVIAGGYYHSLALKEDGTVWGWGDNVYGQLGDGTAEERTSPVQMSGLTGVTVIAGGFSHSMALKEDGTVWACGYGQMGDGTTAMRTSPVRASGLTGVTAIAGGDFYSLVLKEDGTVWAWGRNNYGQLGGCILYILNVYPIGLYGNPPTVTAILTDTELALTYDSIGGTIYYEVEIDGTSINNGSNMIYTYPIATPGYQPTYRVRSINETGPGLWSVNAPAEGELGTITNNSVQTAWEDNGNPTGTLYKAVAFNDENELVTASEWSSSLSGTITGLSSGTEYIIKIKAKNQDEVESFWLEIGTATTLGGTVSYSSYYDNQNRLDYITISSGGIIDYQYDANGNLIGISQDE